jgi:hypothetical protein
MKPSSQTSLVRNLGVALFALAFTLGSSHSLALAATSAGTVISNQATINYQDASGNAYTSISNTVTTTVQNVASLTVTAGAGSNYAPGQQVSDSFTLTNTGNGAGIFNVTSIAPPGNAVAGSPTYTFNSNAYTTLAALQAAITAAGNTGAAGSITIGVTYTIANTAVPPLTEATTLTATITYPAAGSAPAQTSASASATQTDNLVADARLDLQKASVQPANAGANIAYTITANNGGAMPAKDLTSVKTLLGAAVPGILITDLVPSFPLGTPLTVSNIVATPNTANGFSSTATAKIYVAPAATGPWTAYTGPGNAAAGTKYIGVFISGGTGGVELAAKPSGSTNGSVSAPQITITFQTTQPTGTGSADANAVVNQADSVIGGNQGASAAVGSNVIGPGIAANTADSVAAITTGGQGIVYPTPSAPQAAPAGTSGASNTVGNSAFAAPGVVTGPLGFPGATGSWNGVATNNNSNDFTAKAFDPAGFNQTNLATVPGPPTGNTLAATALVDVPSSFQNTGNLATNVTIAVTTMPAGWLAQIFAANAAGVIQGTTLSGAASASPTATFSNVASNATLHYVVEYTAPVGTQAFVNQDAVVTATAGGVTNTTHHELILGGPIYLTKTQTLDAATCPNGLAAPGCIITYKVYYYNNAPIGTACTAPVTSVAAAAAGFVTTAGSAVLSEDGAAGGNSWGAATSGLTAALAVDTTAGTTWTGNTLGSTSFTAKIGGASYVFNPGCTGNITFSVVVK